MEHDHHDHSHHGADNAHGHVGDGHDHSHGDTSSAFVIAATINFAYTVIEAAYGFFTDSLALLSDALHNFGDVLGLGMAWGALLLAKRAPTVRHSYGWSRATQLSPLLNSMLLISVSGALAWEAIRRFGALPDVPATPVIVVAAIGIVVNLLGAFFLHGGHEHDLNKRGAYLHLVFDAAVSLATVLAGVGIHWLGWNWLDPLTALLVSVVIAFGSWSLLRDSFDATMDAVPRGIDLDEVDGFLATLPGVSAVHHLHVWALGGGIALTAHLVRAHDDDHDAFLDATADALAEKFGIDHPTLQIERGSNCGHGEHEHAPTSVPHRHH